MATILENQTKAEEPEHRPNIEDLASAFQGPLGIRSIALTGLFVLACFYTLYFAREFFLPIVLAVVFSFLLSPVVRGLKKLRIPEAVGAGIVIVIVFGGIAFAFYEMASPITAWLEKAPSLGREIQRKIHNLEKPVAKVTQASEQVEQLTTLPSNQPKPQKVVIQQPGPLDGLFNRGLDFLFGLAVVVILLYFLLASGDMFLRKLIHVLPRLADKKKAVQIAREVEENISRYLFTVAMINAGLGISASFAFLALGMPNPFLWGLMGGLLNFIPFVGAATTIVITGVVAMATFPTVAHALAIPGTYLTLSIIEGNFVNPWIVGRRLTLNPVVIFVGLTFWGWLWGIPGALLAVPMLAMFKIFCDHIEPLAPIGEFLGH